MQEGEKWWLELGGGFEALKSWGTVGGRWRWEDAGGYRGGHVLLGGMRTLGLLHSEYVP
jgi:hypothetical protein